MAYVGRFAPSPTGRLHLGSLATALGSFLEARNRGGRWLLRIEDLDTARTVPGAAEDILATLRLLGLEWDGPVVYQTQRSAAYLAALESLQRQGLVYGCSCTRRELAESDPGRGYPGTCRSGARGPPPLALRLRLDDQAIEAFDDRLQGHCSYRLSSLGDPIIRRRDGLFAYQLAVVVDDADAGVTDVVRGADLLGSSPWQRVLQRALGLPHPTLCHLPLITAATGQKLSKSRSAVSLDPRRAPDWLLLALGLLHQHPPPELSGQPVPQIIEWAVAHWNPESLRGLATLPAPVGLGE
jgi:glutamyl-Q tRNA(Asp) synthetase